MAIEGSLQSVDIQDIAQLLNINRSTGLLHIQNSHVKGVLYYREGDIVNAEVEGMMGSSAAYALMSQGEGNFHFEIAAHDKSREITRSIYDLLLEAARRKDTIKKIRATIKHDNIVFMPLVDVRIPHLAKDFTEFEKKLLEQLDGHKEIREIINNNKKSAFEIFFVIYELEKKGHLKRVDIFKVLEVAPLKKLFGKKNEVYIPERVINEWQDQSMAYANCEAVEIRTNKMLFGEVRAHVKAGVESGTIQLPKPIMDQFEVVPGDKVLIKPVKLD